MEPADPAEKDCFPTLASQCENRVSLPVPFGLHEVGKVGFQRAGSLM